MPPTGFKTLTIREELYKDIEKEAKKNGKKVAQHVTDILQEAISLEVPAE